MEMSFQQYIDNPMGKRNAVFSQRDIYKSLYTEKFDKILLREAGKINYSLYVDKKKDRYIIHIKIPSETVKDLYYDAVILFYSNDPAAKSSPSLQEYKAKFFSNDPAFVYTYLHVFLENNILFDDLKPRCSNVALKKDPKVKNPYKVVGYSKILYFAYLYMKSKNLFAKHMYTTYGRDYKPKELLDTVEHSDRKIADRQELGRIANIRKDDGGGGQSRERESSERTNVNNTSGRVRSTNMVNTVGKVPYTKRMPSAKTTKKISRKGR